jgi:hypothetical protein
VTLRLNVVIHRRGHDVRPRWHVEVQMPDGTTLYARRTSLTDALHLAATKIAQHLATVAGRPEG